MICRSFSYSNSFTVFLPVRYLCVYHCLSFLPDNHRPTLCRRDFGTEVLQLQQVIGSELIGLWGWGGCQPAVVCCRGRAATAATTLRRPLQADAFSALHHGPQLQHQGVGYQLLSCSLAGHFRLKGENSGPRKHLEKTQRVGEEETEKYLS